MRSSGHAAVLAAGLALLLGCSGDALSRFLYAVFYSYPVLIVKVIMDSFLSPLKAIFGENVVRRKIARFLLLLHCQTCSLVQQLGRLLRNTVLNIKKILLLNLFKTVAAHLSILVPMRQKEKQSTTTLDLLLKRWRSLIWIRKEDQLIQM